MVLEFQDKKQRELIYKFSKHHSPFWMTVADYKKRGEVSKNKRNHL